MCANVPLYLFWSHTHNFPRVCQHVKVKCTASLMPVYQ
jgi:hypothetical protein